MKWAAERAQDGRRRERAEAIRWHQTSAPSTGKIYQLRDQEPYRWQRRPHTQNSPVKGAAACSGGAAMDVERRRPSWSIGDGDW
jgi:hypothetical protein